MELLNNFRGFLDSDSTEFDLISQLDPARLPRHIAVIMDGNGRWACQRGLPRVEGHRAGTKAVRSTVEYSRRLGIQHLTLYAFSAENWKRPDAEVSTLWELLRLYLRKELRSIRQNQIRLRTIGRTGELPETVVKDLERAQSETADNTGMQLIVALNYSGRLELVDAFNRLAQRHSEAPVDEAQLAANLYTSGVPDPDLLIRTSGEMRLSNFLLWQVAYSEIYVSPVLWPDFKGRDLLEAILEYQRRERRYGGILTEKMPSR